MTDGEMTAMIDVDENMLAPEIRAIGLPSGVPLEVDGATWLLARGGVAKVLDPYRDRMDDQARLAQTVAMLDVFEVARVCLASNYRLSDPEIIHLLEGADREKLIEATMSALFGASSPHRTYTMWMISGLYAAGLDPETIPAEWIPEVLYQLVKARRILPISEYTDAAVAAPKIAAMRARAAMQQVVAATPKEPSGA